MCNFDDWLGSVDKSFQWKFQMSINDVEDFCWADCFDSDMTEDEAIEAFVTEYPEYDI